MAASTAEIEAAERWFVDHGLPYFVDGYRASVARGLTRARLVPALVVAVVLAAVVGAAAAPLLGAAASLGAALTTVGLVLAAYAVATLRAWLIVVWALRRTFGSLGLLVPLVTRALPLLLLFITFLFINTEVWQVAAALDSGVLWIAVLLFAAVAVGFLLTRLPEELDRVDDQVEAEQLVEACAGTPFEPTSRAIADRVDRVGGVHAEVTGLQRANLVLVLLVTQFVQVLLLAVAVWAFFLLFGVVAMDPAVLELWLTHPLTVVRGPVGDVFGTRLSLELLRVATFLAAFSGLYFTVYAVTDDLYRRQFFSAVTRELERAVSARVAYREMRRGDGSPPVEGD